MNNPKFLVIQTAFTGDVILATGLLQKLKQHYVNAEIDILVRKGNEELLFNNPFTNEVLIWNKKNKKIRNLFLLLKKIRRKKYTRVINLHRFLSTGILTAFSGADFTIGFENNPLSFLFSKRIKHKKSDGEHYLHEIEKNHELIKDFTDNQPAKPFLYISEKEIAKTKEYTNGVYITIAPASVWFTKQFPAKKWIEFIESLPIDVKVYLIGGPGDKLLADQIISNIHSGIKLHNFCGALNFHESAALMKHAVMNYVNDSSPLHLASAINAPVTAIFCSTIPEFGFTPLSDRSFIIEIKSKLECRPCGIHGKRSCPRKHFHCAQHISNDQLLATLVV